MVHAEKCRRHQIDSGVTGRAYYGRRMRLRKFGHACVRLEDGDRLLVIDPGTYTEPEALVGATAVLVTHEHADHADVDQLEAACRADPALTVHGPAGWVESVTPRLGDGAHGVDVGESFTAAGFAVTAVGGRHAEIIDGLPGCANLGYVVEGVYHPGDSYFVPSELVETLLVPASGPWTRHRDAIEYVRAIRPARAVPIHDALYSELGWRNFDAWLSDEEPEYTRIPIGGSAEL
jgi:L-ascorbate metabolism protein UlaG (beta-lactamase superfamily)